MDSLEENLEFFSSEGRPLRASMSVSLSQQKITEFTIKDPASNSAGAQTPGTRPLTEAPKGNNLQSMADSQGKGGDWQSIASANNIENPRLLAPGQLIDMNATLPKVSFGVQASVTAGAQVGTQGGSSQGGVGVSVGGSFGLG
jgi:hypothetical protein